MLTSHLTRWFARPAGCGISAERQRVVAPVPSDSRARRLAAAGAAVQVLVSQTAADLVIQVKGEARVECVDALLDGLLTATACRPAVVTLDLTELRSISSLAMGALTAYRRGVVRTGGRVRLARELQPAVHEALARAELLSLFESTADA
jgi:anti-anti-sigma factor